MAMKATEMPSDKAPPWIGLGQRDIDLLPKVAGADKGGDDQHRKCEHDGLVEAEQDFGHREAQADTREDLPVRAAHGATGLDQLRVDAAQAEDRVAHGRHKRVGHHGDHGCEVTDPEQHDRRHE
jgi:hypothetical protein